MKKTDNSDNSKLWGGRFSGQSDPLADAFNASLPVDKRLYKVDIAGSIAHAEMLGATGIIPAADAALITEGLRGILSDIERGVLIPENAEDIHMFTERELTRRIGGAGKKLHTARSRNDQTATDTRLFAKEAVKTVDARLSALIEALAAVAAGHGNAILPGYTHLQKAQPITLARHLGAYADGFTRDRERFADCGRRMDFSPLGAGALGGTTFPIDRKMTAEKLGFAGVIGNTVDAVSDRDFVLEFAAHACICMTRLSRICEEFVLWSTEEFGFIELDDRYATGSSMMPQKKNPDTCELIRGKTGRVYGGLIALLTVMKGLPLAYNKDMQEDKTHLFDIFDTLESCLAVFTRMLTSAEFKTDNMRLSAEGGFMAATDIADYLVKAGVPFRSAHEITGKLVKHCIENRLTFADLQPKDWQLFSPAFTPDITQIIPPETMVKRREEK
jgi:argininosuccinate lyase